MPTETRRSAEDLKQQIQNTNDPQKLQSISTRLVDRFENVRHSIEEDGSYDDIDSMNETWDELGREFQ